MNIGFWFRWSMRDLRARFLQILATAIIVALGTGVYAGFGGQQRWRESSYDASFAQLNMFDLQLSFTDGNFVDKASIAALLDDFDGIKVYESRLVVPTLVEVQSDGENSFVQGQLVGIDIHATQPHISDIYTTMGRKFNDPDSGLNVAIVDGHFARFYDYEAGDTLKISGRTALEVIGAGVSPEYFQIIPPNGILGNEGNYAVIFMPLHSVQRIAGKTASVNDVVISLEANASIDVVQSEIGAALASHIELSNLSYEFTQKQDHPVYKLMYADAKNDQGIMAVLAILFLLGSAMTAFNLASRMVQSQRRQIGIGMALGIKPMWLAIRPMMFGVQIAIIGALLGVPIGYGLSVLLSKLFQSLLILPTWTSIFYFPNYIVGILLGVTVPIVATLYPVWKAVRVEPLQAIHTGILAPNGSIVAFVRDIPLPGRSFVKVPVRNLLRAPARSIFTLLGIAIGIILLTLMLGVGDSFRATGKQMESAYLDQSDKRMMVFLDGFYPLDTSSVQSMSQLESPDGSPLLQNSDAGLVLEGKARAGNIEADTTIELLDMQNEIWRPTSLEGHLPNSADEIVISEKMAHDLGVGIGDSIMLVHPVRQDAQKFGTQETLFRISGIHDNPLRAPSYLSTDAANLFNMLGLTNYLVVVPANGVSQNTVQKVIFSQPNIIAIQAAEELPKTFNDSLAILNQILKLTGIIVIVLSFLVAFNITSINLDERVREIATMFAFGLRLRTVTRMQILENVVMGIGGTLVGIVLGYVLLQLLFQTQFAEQFPDIQFQVRVSSTTVLVAALIGVLVVAVTPLFTIRRIARMNIPDMLRVVE